MADDDFQNIKSVLRTGFQLIEKMENGASFDFIIPSGFPNLQYYQGDLIVLSGEPGVGKTSFIICSLVNIGKLGEPVALMSLGLSLEEISLKILACESRFPIISKGIIAVSNWCKVTSAAGRLMDAPIYINDSIREATIDVIIEKIRTAKRIIPRLRLIIIDSLQGITSRDDQIPECMRRLKEVSRELYLSVIVTNSISTKDRIGLEGIETYAAIIMELIADINSGKKEYLVHDSGEDQEGHFIYRYNSKLILHKNNRGSLETLHFEFLPQLATFIPVGSGSGKTFSLDRYDSDGYKH